MKNKITSILIAITILLFNFNIVSAITPSAKIELDNYSYTINNLQNVKISGTVSKAYGQKLIVKNSNNSPILLKDLPNANGSSANFEFTIESSRISEGTNTFQIQSSNLMGKVSASNPKTITITYKKQSKQNQVITVSDKSVQVGKIINLNATVNSGLQLSYFSKNADVATVDGKGVVTGKKEGTVVIEISQNGDDKWNSVKKEVKVTVTKASTVVVKKDQTITASNKKVKVGKSISLGAKVSSGLKPTYKSSNTKVATVDANGKVTGKKIGKATITITQVGNNNWKSTSKTVTITVSSRTYTIQYNPNSGSGKVYTQTGYVDDTTTLTANKFKRKGYIFKGWATEKSKGKVAVARKPSAKDIAWEKLKANQKQNLTNKCKVVNLGSEGKTVKLYAVWEAVKTNISISNIKQSNSTISFNFTANVTDGTTYKIAKSPNNKLLKSGKLKNGKISGSVKDTKLSSGTTCKYRIAVYNSKGSRIAYKDVYLHTTGNGVDGVVHYNGKHYKMYRQYKGSYRSDKFGNDLPMGGSISANGCGPSSIAIVMSGYGYNLNPGQVGRALGSTAKRMGRTSVTRNPVFRTYLKSKGFNVVSHYNRESNSTIKAQLKKALKANRQVVFWVGEGGTRSCWRKFTRSGYHYIAIIGINKKGDKVYIINPNDMNDGWNDITTVAKACHETRGWIEVWK